MSDEVIFSRTDKKILKIIEKSDRPISKTQIAKRIKLCPATVSKYVDVLAAKGVLDVEMYGNIHLVSLRGTNAN